MRDRVVGMASTLRHAPPPKLANESWQDWLARQANPKPRAGDDKRPQPAVQAALLEAIEMKNAAGLPSAALKS